MWHGATHIAEARVGSTSSADWKRWRKTLASSASVFLDDDLSAVVREHALTGGPVSCSTAFHALRALSSCRIITRGSRLVRDCRRLRSRLVSERESGCRAVDRPERLIRSRVRGPGVERSETTAILSVHDWCRHRKGSHRRCASGRPTQSGLPRRSDTRAGTGHVDSDEHRFGRPGG